MTKEKNAAFFVMCGLMLVSGAYSVFELASEMSAISQVLLSDAISMVLQSLGSSAAFSLVAVVVAAALLALNLLNGMISKNSATTAGVFSILLRVPSNIVLILLTFALAFMIYAEYLHTGVANPLSGSIVTDIVTAASAFSLVFIRKF